MRFSSCIHPGGGIARFPARIRRHHHLQDRSPSQFRAVRRDAVAGELTIRGVTKPVVLEVSAPKPAIKDPWGLQRTAVSGFTKINRQDFGVAWSKTLDSGGVVVGDNVDITLDVEMFVPPPGR